MSLWAPLCDVGDWRKRSRYPISPQVGEMSGRTEGGASLSHQKVLHRRDALMSRNGLRRSTAQPCH
ncbi:MAG: hypothetical protein E5X67_24985 [Mesorhizobium sp.]|nr:MAG: hypothetical protein E5X67_24985 [Mesorhizobium sp.]